MLLPIHGEMVVLLLPIYGEVAAEPPEGLNETRPQRRVIGEGSPPFTARW